MDNMPNPTKLDDAAIDRIARAAVWAATLIVVAITLIPALVLYQAYAN